MMDLTKNLIFSIALIFGALVGYSQKVEVSKAATFNGSYMFAHNPVNNTVYGASVMATATYPNEVYHDFEPVVFKFNSQRQVEKQLKITIPGYQSHEPERFDGSFPSIHWNKTTQTLDVVISVFNIPPHDTIELKTFLVKYDEDLNKISETVIDSNKKSRLMIGNFFNDSTLFTTNISFGDGHIYMGRYNLNSGDKVILKDLYTGPVNYFIAGILPLSLDFAIATIGHSIYHVNFGEHTVVEKNNLFSSWPQLIYPLWPHYITQDTNIAMLGTNQDSFRVFNTKNHNISFNVFGKNNNKIDYKIFPINSKYHNSGTYYYVTIVDSFFYVLSNVSDTSNIPFIKFRNYFSTPSNVLLTKIDLSGNFIWSKEIKSKTGSPVVCSIGSIDQNELVIAYDEWNYIEHPNEFVKDLVFVFMNTDGEVLSTQTIATENIADFLVYPNPVAQGEPLTLQLNETFNGQQQIHITSLNGALVQQQQVVVANGKTQINVNQLAAGQYLISVNGSHNTTVPLVVK